MKDNVMFKLLNKEHIFGKTRNIYIKINKNSSRITKTKFVKYKGEFVKLTHFIKENYKNKKRSNKYKNNVTIINNINEIKDLNIRKLYKKNAKIYIFNKNNKKGGGPFKTDVLRNSDPGIQREILSQLHDNIEIKYNKIDDIIDDIDVVENHDAIFEIVNNLWYNININGTSFCIRPYIKYKRYDHIIIDFYFSINNSRQWENFDLLSRKWYDLGIGGNVYGDRKWIKMPVHITLFFSVIKKSGMLRPYYISKHIHITSEDIEKFNIKTINGLTIHKHKTHTYLVANNLQKVLDIMKEHGEKIFKDWVHVEPRYSDGEDKVITINCPYPRTKTWEKPNPKIIEYLNFSNYLHEYEKKAVCDGINNLYLIIYDIVYNIIPTDIPNNNDGNWYDFKPYHQEQDMRTQDMHSRGMTRRDFYRTYVDEYLDERKTIENNEYIKFTYTENDKKPKVSYINKEGDLIRESSIKIMSDDGTVSDLRSSRTDSPSFRSPSRTVRTDSSSFRSPSRIGRTDSSSVRSPSRTGRVDSSSMGPPARPSSIMGMLGTATSRVMGPISSLATSAFPINPREERRPSARDRTPVRR
jgi:hypothetical protein